MKFRIILAAALTAGTIAGAVTPAIAAPAAPASVVAIASVNTNRCSPFLFIVTQVCAGATVSGTEIQKIKGYVDVGQKGTFFAAILYPGGTQSTGVFSVAGDSRGRSTPTAVINRRWPSGAAIHVVLYQGTPGHSRLIRSGNWHVRDLYRTGGR